MNGILKGFKYEGIDKFLIVINILKLGLELKHRNNRMLMLGM
jgi:hypothetical protein